jgi:chorismate mutase / prephenate dehydratase
MLPQDGILDVCAYVARHPQAHGIVPIENSSGGTINETVDVLLDTSQPVYIQEELSLHVQLALLGHRNNPIKRLYSHFVPFEHCAPWIAQHLPGVHKQECESTAAAAARAASDPEGAALCSRFLARRFKLDQLEFPVASSTPNITTFIVIAARPVRLQRIRKTTLALRLPNTPGSLYRFLETLQAEKINLSRLVSRPIRGKRQEYAFLVDLDADARSAPVRRALEEAGKEATSLRICGSFPTHRTYQS